MLEKKCSSAFKDVIFPDSGSCRRDKSDIKKIWIPLLVAQQQAYTFQM